MRILALTFGDLTCASTYYRVGQHLDRLKEDGIECELLTGGSATLPTAGQLSSCDVLLVQKRLFSCRTVNYLRRHAKRLVYDTDDATWHPQRRKHNWLTRWRTQRRLKTVVRAADVCVVANHHLGDHLRSLGGQIQLIPMSLNEKEWPEPPHGRTADRVRIGWSGAPANLRYLEELEPVLHEILRRHSTAEIAVFCGERPRFKNGLPYAYLPWQKGGEHAAISTFNLGLLPLPMDAFSQGKSPIKALQYMAVGIPLVATPAAGALEIGKPQNGVHFAHFPEQWLQLLGELIVNPELRCSQGLAARQFFAANYAAGQVYQKWIKVVTQS